MPPSSGLEVVAPVTSDVEFKFTWAIDGFLRIAKGGGGPASGSSSSSSSSTDLITPNTHSTVVDNGQGGLDSGAFDININGVETRWNLSVRFWTGEDGERLANPFVLCLNMLSCKVDKPTNVDVKYKFGVLNRASGQFEMASPELKPNLMLETSSELRSVGYRNVAISDKHLSGSGGDICLVCRVKLVKDDADVHSLSSDLKAMLGDDSTADLVIQTDEGKTFNVHKNILSARSPVFANLLKQPTTPKVEEKKTEPVENNDAKPSADEKVKDESDSMKKTFAKKEKLELHNLKAETVNELLSYIYTDSSFNVDTMANSLLEAADSYQLPGLKTHCERQLDETLSPKNVASVLLLADRHKCQRLKKSALSYCRANHTYIMKDADWKVIERERPGLFEEAVAEVIAKDFCETHTECLKRKGKRYEIEKNSSVPQFDRKTLVEE